MPWWSARPEPCARANPWWSTRPEPCARANTMPWEAWPGVAVFSPGASQGKLQQQGGEVYTQGGQLCGLRTNCNNRGWRSLEAERQMSLVNLGQVTLLTTLGPHRRGRVQKVVLQEQ